MSRWPLKLKVGIYCAVLTVLALAGAAAVTLAYIYHRQLAALDEEVSGDIKELMIDLEEQIGPASGWQRALSHKLIPTSLRRRYITIERTDGVELYRTGQTYFKNLDLRQLKLGGDTIPVPDFKTGQPLNCRFVSLKFGNVIVRMGTRLGTIETMQEDLRASFSLVLPAFGLLVFIGAIWLARHALRPVSAMTAAAERISAESPAERLPQPRAKDEIARLTLVLNESFDRLQRAYNSAARFSADASHQLKTPIAVLRAGLDELRLGHSLKTEDLEIVDVLLQQTRRLTTLVEDLLLLAQADAGRLRLEPQPLDLVPVIAVILDDIEALGSDSGITLERRLPAQLFARADGRRVKIILQNLGENAVKYNRPDGRIRFAAQRDGDWVSVSVANTGSPIPEQYRERLFERFNRAGMGENIKGHGLGLNIARELARAHGGDLTLTRSDGEWTEFTLRLPASERPAVPQPAPAVAVTA